MQNFETNLENQKEIYESWLTILEVKGILTIPMYILAFYCIIRRSPQFEQHYKIVLAAHVFFCLSEEFYVFVLVHPFIFLPIIGVYADGVLSNLFNIHPFIQLLVFFLLIHLNAGVMVHISFYRLKVVIPMSYRYYTMVIKLGIGFLIVLYITCCLSITVFTLLIEDQQEAKLYIFEIVRPLPAVFNSDKYIVSTARSDNFTLFLIICLTFLIFHITLSFGILFSAFYILYRTKETMSEKVLNAQKTYLKTLVIQVTVVMSFLILPFLILGICMKYNMQSITLLILAMILVVSHGSISTFTLILGTKPYRRTLQNMVLSFLEVLYSLAMRPAVYIPIIGIYANGIMTSVFNIHAFIQITGQILITEINSAVLVHIALLRLRVIIPKTYLFYSSIINVGKFVLVYVYVMSVASAIGFSLLYENQVDAKIYYQQKLSNVPNSFWQSNFIVSTGRSDNFHIFILVGVIFLSIHCLIGASILSIAYYILLRTRKRMSEKVLAAQRSYIHMLFVRILIMVALNIVPYGIFAAAMSLRMSNPYVMSFSLFLFAIYGTASTTSLMLTTRPYRRVLLTCTRKSSDTVIRDTIDHNSHVAGSTPQTKNDN